MGIFLYFLLFSLVLPSPAYAIPSPDLVVGSLSSISQLVTLLSASLGGTALAGGRFAFARGTKRSWGAASSGLLGAAGILLVVAIGLNGYQFLAHRDAETARLSQTLSRPSHDPGAQVLDPTLSEISYREQLVSPIGMTTDELATLLREKDEGKDVNAAFFDVREDAEAAMGTVRGFTHVRFPDFAASGRKLHGKKIILMCDTGNRSHEVAELLRAQGLEAYFIIGGTEKWITEGRPLNGFSERTAESLRSIPSYRNDKVLLDTQTVRKLAEKNNALFIDVRYPGEFEHGHLPGALNIPIRRLPSADLRQAIANVPMRPIILVCYDRRSCFMSLVLGFELSKTGRDIRGRYTVPWEYFVPGAEPPYIAQWHQLTDASWRAKASNWLSNLLEQADLKFGGLFAAILLLALASRALVLPFTVATERDQLKLRRLAPDMEKIAHACDGDPQRKSRAIKELYQKHGIRPARNLLSLLLLPLFLVSLDAIARTAERVPSSFLWISDLSGKDPYFVLPAVFGVLVSLYLHWAVAKTRRHKVIVWCIAAPSCMAMALALSAGGVVYMILSVALMLIQRAAVVLPIGTVRRYVLARKEVLPLADADAQACGNKAVRLAKLLQAGIPVPSGVVLTPNFCGAHLEKVSALHDRALARVIRRLPDTRFAVRSSGAREDGIENSFAGVFETVLNVAKAGIPVAVDQVWKSFSSERARTYGRASETGSIIIQQMVDAEYAGVLFTEDPTHAGRMLVELVKGTGDSLVSGTATPEMVRLGRFTGQPFDEMEPPIELAPLFTLARRCEALFGKPQDIEWAYRDGSFFILQSRDITRTVSTNLGQASRAGSLERERGRLAAQLAAGENLADASFRQDELSELLPRPTPCSLSVMERLWCSGGSVDLACRGLGLDYKVREDAPSYVVSAFGRLYVNQGEAQRRAPHVEGFARRRLRRAASQVEESSRALFAALEPELAFLEAVDFERMQPDALVAAFGQRLDHFITKTHVAVETINIVADFHVQTAHRMLEERGLNPARYLRPRGENILHQVAAITDPKARLARFFDVFGHRAPLDYELSAPRYRDDAGLAARYIAGLTSAPAIPDRQQEDATARIELVETACRLQDLKEEAKHRSLREFALLRSILRGLDSRFALDGLVFHLTAEEIAQLCPGNVEALRALAAERKREAELFREIPPLPTHLSLVDLETVVLEGAEPSAKGSGAMKGTLVSGAGSVIGRAYVVDLEDAESGASLEGFLDGDIIVSRLIHPNWLQYFSRASGFVSELGGWLSHTAILAREYSLPMVVGIPAHGHIPFGAIVQINADGSITTQAPQLSAVG